MTRLTAILISFGVGACSAIGVTGPPSRLSAHGFACTDSLALPIADTVTAAIATAVVIVASATDSRTPQSDGPSAQGKGLIVAGGVVVGAPSLISAVYGYDKVSGCRVAHSDHQVRFAAHHAALTQAWNLATKATFAGRRGDCATVKQLDVELRTLDADVHDNVFAHDAGVAACLASAPYCFDETSDKITHVCLGSKWECQQAIELLPTGTTTTQCALEMVPGSR